MPVTTAYHAGQIPVYYNHQYNSCWVSRLEAWDSPNYVDLPHTPRYCLWRSGLSYTQFSYSDLKLSKKGNLAPFETIEIQSGCRERGRRGGR